MSAATHTDWRRAGNTIFINGIWKSGNHLLKKLVDLLGVQSGNLGIASSLLLGRARFIRCIVRGSWFEPFPIDVGLEAAACVSTKWLRSALARRAGKYVTGHCAYSYRLMQLLSELGIRVVQITRDPRDIVVSFSEWIVKRPDFYAYQAFADLGFEDRMLGVIEGIHRNGICWESIGSVIDKTLGWVMSPEVLVVRFEDLVGEQGGGSAERQEEAIMKIVAWIGMDINQDKLRMVRDELYGGTRTFNVGRVGRWKELMSSHVARRFMEVVGGDRMRAFGYY